MHASGSAYGARAQLANSELYLLALVVEVVFVNELQNILPPAIVVGQR